MEEGRKHQKCAVIGPRILDPAGTLQESARGDPDMLTGLFGRTTIGSRLFPRLTPARRNLLSASLAKTTESSHPVDWVSGACMLARRDALVGVRGFDEGYFLYWEDADLCRRLRNTGWEIRYMPEATAVHDVGQSSQAAPSLANREFHRSAYRYFATHVFPQKWHPARLLAWAILRLRSRLKSPRRLRVRSAPHGDRLTRVARIITRLNIGGPSVQAIDLSRELESSGFETCLIHGHLAEGEGDMTKWLPLHAAKTAYVNELVRPISPLKDLRAFGRSTRLSLSEQPDIVHTHMAKAGTLGRLACLVLTGHLESGHAPTRPYLPWSCVRRLLRSAHGPRFPFHRRYLAKRTDALMAISPKVEHDLLETYRIARRISSGTFHSDSISIDLSRCQPSIAHEQRKRFEIPADRDGHRDGRPFTAIKQQSLFLKMASCLAQGQGSFRLSDRRRWRIAPRSRGRSKTARHCFADTFSRVAWRSRDDLRRPPISFVLTSRNEGLRFH